MKEISILNENYIQTMSNISKSKDEAKNNVEVILEFVDKSTDALFENDDVNNTSPEYFEYKAKFAAVLTEKAEYDINDLLLNKYFKVDNLTNISECVYIDNILNPNTDRHNYIETANYLFGEDCTINEDYSFSGKVNSAYLKDLKNRHEEALNNINEAFKTLAACDKDVIKENAREVLLIEQLVEDIKNK